jgi:hypothetical protein
MDRFKAEKDDGLIREGKTVVLVEEFASLFDGLPAKDAREYQRRWVEFSRLCREFNYRIILCSQVFSAEIMRTAADRANFPTRFLLANADDTLKKMMFEDYASELTESCPAGTGYYYLSGTMSVDDEHYMNKPRRFTMRDVINDFPSLGAGIRKMLDRY